MQTGFLQLGYAVYFLFQVFAKKLRIYLVNRSSGSPEVFNHGVGCRAVATRRHVVPFSGARGATYTGAPVTYGGPPATYAGPPITAYAGPPVTTYAAQAPPRPCTPQRQGDLFSALETWLARGPGFRWWMVFFVFFLTSIFGIVLDFFPFKTLQSSLIWLTSTDVAGFG